MKVLSRCLFLTVLATAMIFSFIFVASAQEIKDKAGWLIGSWKGFVAGQKNDWTLELKSIDTTTVTDGKESIDIKGTVKFKDGKPSNLTVKLINNKVIFNLWGKEDYALERINETRMEGSKKDPGGKEYMIRFWKLGKEGAVIDSMRNNPLFGAWEGFCQHGRKERFAIEYIDTTAATIRFEWGILMDKVNNIKEDWKWQNASISPNGELKVDEGQSLYIFKLSKNQQHLEGEMFSADKKTDSINLSKADTTAPSSSTGQNVPESISALLGTWEGSWGIGTSRLIIEKINLKEVVCVYSWPDNPNDSSKGGQTRFTGKIDEKKGAILWEVGGKKFTFTMDKDLKTIHGRAESPNNLSTITMKRKQ